MGSGAVGSTKAQPRRGSSFTDKQIAYSVKDGKAITVRLSHGERVTGWVFGLDDFHIGVVTPDERIMLVHKTAPQIEITDMLLSQLPDQDAQQKLSALVEPFRGYVMREHFQASPAIT